MRRASLGDFLGHEARNAINDIRQKVFEEAFFGRATTARPVIEISRDHEPEKSRTLEEIWGGRPQEPNVHEQSKEQDVEPEIER